VIVIRIEFARIASPIWAAVCSCSGRLMTMQIRSICYTARMS
jgi:hypothetical protein